jgi:hypothetical protein
VAARITRHPLTIFAFEALLVVVAYFAYSGLRIVVEGGQTVAVEHAFEVVTLEQSLRIFHEASVQRAVEGQPWLAASMDWYYLWAYLPILVAAGVIVYCRDRALYGSYRNTMFVSAGIGLLIFAVLPVAPPRMLPEYGFLDTVHVTATSSVKNDFAAVPSFHFGFTLLAALAVAHAFAFRRWLCVALAALPALMLLSIVATANHFFLDAFVGSVVVMGVWYRFVANRPQQPFDEPAPAPAMAPP